jgi:uncharacterized protein (DUF305 family)
MRQTLLHLSILALAASSSIPLQAQTPTRVMGAPYHDASRAFIDVMTPHHEMAMMMSEHAITSARSDAVKEIARKMVDEQKKEIAELKAARKALFGSDSSRSSMMHGMMQMMGRQHMSDSGARPTMDSIHAQHRPAQPPGQRPAAMGREQRAGAMSHDMMGGSFDRMFLEHMISHHQEGIDVALIAEHSEAAAGVKELAKKTREGQERDIAEMRRMLASLPAAPTPVRKP